MPVSKRRSQGKKIAIAVFASGNGSNFEAIARRIKQKKLHGARIKLLITDKEHAYVRVRAKKYQVKDIFVDPKKFKDRVAFDKKIAGILIDEGIDLVVLAGFMRILSPYFVNKFRHRILNIHPALLPAFKGEDSIKRAYHYGVKVTGVTVHFVDTHVDHGPIVLQQSLEVKSQDSLDALEEKIHRIEHNLYPRAIDLFIKGKLAIKGRRVQII